MISKRRESKGLSGAVSADEVYNDRATWRRMSSYIDSPHKSGNKRKEKKKNTIRYNQSHFIFDT